MNNINYIFEKLDDDSAKIRSNFAEEPNFSFYYIFLVKNNKSGSL